MNIGEALVVCTVLVLAVFRRDFRKFLLWTLVVGVALCAVGGGLWWGWAVYQEHVEQVATAKHHADVDACVKRLTSINPNSPPETLPPEWFTAVDACEKNPSAPPQIDFAKNEEPSKPLTSGSVVEIHGGETLKIIEDHNPPRGSIPFVYLGHKQKFFLVCGVFGEQGQYPTIANSTASCP